MKACYHLLLQMWLVVCCYRPNLLCCFFLLCFGCGSPPIPTHPLAGLLIMIGCYFLDVAGMEGWYGLGVFVFVGAGAMVSVGNFVTHYHGPKTGHVDLWVQVMCEPRGLGLNPRLG